MLAAATKATKHLPLHPKDLRCDKAVNNEQKAGFRISFQQESQLLNRRYSSNSILHIVLALN